MASILARALRRRRGERTAGSATPEPRPSARRECDALPANADDLRIPPENERRVLAAETDRRCSRPCRFSRCGRRRRVERCAVHRMQLVFTAGHSVLWCRESTVAAASKPLPAPRLPVCALIGVSGTSFSRSPNTVSSPRISARSCVRNPFAERHDQIDVGRRNLGVVARRH